jgi:hypothetical protein
MTGRKEVGFQTCAHQDILIMMRMFGTIDSTARTMLQAYCTALSPPSIIKYELSWMEEVD